MDNFFRKPLAYVVLSLALAGCTYNPFNDNNHLTGSPVGAVIGAGAAAGTASALGVTSKGALALAGLGGAGVGYYATTLRFASGGVIQAGGQVYQVGDYITIEIPSDYLFEPNTAEFLPCATPALKSATSILARYPNHNIMISGNTSGAGPDRWEQKLSEERARQVAFFVWAEGIQDMKDQSFETRQLSFVGYGNFFPIANHLTNEGIRSNSRIQITIYPTRDQLLLTKRARTACGPDVRSGTQKFYTIDRWQKIFPNVEIIAS